MLREKIICSSTRWNFNAEMNESHQGSRCRDGKKYNKLYNQNKYSQKVNVGESSIPLNVGRSSFNDKDMKVEKPPMSYVALITMAIRSSPDGRLTLSEIYDYLIKNFEFFRASQSRGWMNAVRHNLTLNDCFVKLPRDPLMRGKGSFWCIDPESTGMFNHGSLKRRRTRYKRARNEVDVVRDIMSGRGSTIPYTQGSQQRIEPCRPCCRKRTFSPVIDRPPNKQFSNFSIDAILGNEPTKRLQEPKQILKFCSTEVWQ